MCRSLILGLITRSSHHYLLLITSSDKVNTHKCTVTIDRAMINRVGSQTQSTSTYPTTLRWEEGW